MGPEGSSCEGPSPTQSTSGAGGSPFSHRKPLNPGGQRHAPVTRWQAAPPPAGTVLLSQRTRTHPWDRLRGKRRAGCSGRLPGQRRGGPGSSARSPAPYLSVAHPGEASTPWREPRPHRRGPNPPHSRLWHSSPVQPAGQRQWPVCRSQRPPWRHPQTCWQPAPENPGGHSAEAGAGEGTGEGPAPGAQDTPARPCFPHPEPRIACPWEGGVPSGLVTLQATPQDPDPQLQAATGAGAAPRHAGALALGSRPQGPSFLLRPPARRSPSSQASPAQPSGQVQWPETGSQVPRFRQRQECWQSLP